VSEAAIAAIWSMVPLNRAEAPSQEAVDWWNLRAQTNQANQSTKGTSGTQSRRHSGRPPSQIEIAQERAAFDREQHPETAGHAHQVRHLVGAHDRVPAGPEVEDQHGQRDRDQEVDAAAGEEEEEQRHDQVEDDGEDLVRHVRFAADRREHQLVDKQRGDDQVPVLRRQQRFQPPVVEDDEVVPLVVDEGLARAPLEDQEGRDCGGQRQDDPGDPVRPEAKRPRAQAAEAGRDRRHRLDRRRTSLPYTTAPWLTHRWRGV
jgi:hypothetical protein